ncbi:MAG: hypothetical protein H7Y18_02215, partial [Clostridiaceae bacterium]|nr:hypothetical protein [Clostridiaceae bacterium]
MKINSKLNFKLKGKLMTAFISLITIFSIIIFLVVNYQITNLEHKNINETINAASQMGMSYINEAYIGDYEI